MLKRILVLMVLSALLIGGLSVAAQPAKPSMPALITSGGQSPDGLMLDVLLNKKLNMNIPFIPLAKVSDMKDAKTLIVAVGVSNKGLGAAGIDQAQEIARVKSLLDYAKEQGLYVILVHTGGTQRRGATSDQISKMVAPVAKSYVVVKTGNADKFFSKLAEENKAQLIEISMITEAGPAIQGLFK